jgi:SAM-dependent methyltransferase
MDVNESNRQLWLSQILSKVPARHTLLDVGAGQLKNKSLCTHLSYTSQDFCQHQGSASGCEAGIQVSHWDTSRIDLVSDITEIPAADRSFDAVLCSEVLEHVPDPISALSEMGRLLKDDGLLILTAPFSSCVHMAPHYFYSGFSRYWYEYHLPRFGFEILELTPNGDWFDALNQEASRIGGIQKKLGRLSWPFAYIAACVIKCYIWLQASRQPSDLSCFGWHCLAKKTSTKI